MTGNIFISYRRDESGHVAGRLNDSLAPTFGRNKLFMDVDNIPVGKDFESYLKSQVAVCDAMLAIIGPNWLTTKDEAGQRRLDNSEDFVVIEIAVALARDIPVVPVLVDGARMPKPSELPDSLKPLARRQAVHVRHTSFSGDAETLVKRLRDVLGQKRRWGVPAAIGAAAIAVLLLIGWLGFSWISALRTIKTLGPTPIISVGQNDTQADSVVRATREAEEKRKAHEAEQQRLAAKADQERQARVTAEAEAEQRRLAVLKVEEDRRRAQAETQSRISEAIKQGSEANKTHDFDKAIANYNEAIRLDPKNATAFSNRGNAYAEKGDTDRAIADYSEAIRLNYPNAFFNRGFAYAQKGDTDRAIADYSEAIRLSPNDDFLFNNRGTAYLKKGDTDRAIADYSETIRLNPTHAGAFFSRGLAYARKGDTDRAIANFSEAIRLKPDYARAFCNRGIAKLKINDATGNQDKAKARELDASTCR